MAEALERITHQDFERLVESSFRCDLGDGGEVALRLVEATPMGGEVPEDSERSQPFSALFKGPKEPMLDQAIYPLQHEELGELQLFLVPVGEGDDHIRYEAIFS